MSALITLSACAGAPESENSTDGSDDYPVTIENCEHSVTVDAQPENAVTMNQGATEVALALGVEDQLAGTAYLDDEIPDDWKSEYDSVEVLAEKYPDQETLLEVDPDLVYASYVSAFDKDAAGSRDELVESGIPSYLSSFGCTDAPDEVTFETAWQEVADVAEIFGVPERADEIEQEQQDELERLAEEDAGRDTDVFWYDSGDDNVLAGAGQGGPQLILDAVGANNVFADVDGSWADVSWERVLEADPDVIVLADAESSTAEEKIANLQQDPALRDLRAVQEEAFVTVPFSESTPGVRLVDGADRVAEQLQDLA